LVNRIIINGSRGSFPSPQQASGVFDWNNKEGDTAYLYNSQGNLVSSRNG